MDKIYQKKNPDIKNAAKGKFDAFAAAASVTKERLGCQVKTCRHDGMDKAAERLIFPIKTLGNDQEDVIRKCCNSRSRCFLVQKGFTLIELLVVVLIIGILAAVALPQYTKTVEKVRAAEAISIVRSLYEAKYLYYMSNGEWPDDLSSLDWTWPGIQFDDTNNQGYFLTTHFHCRSWGGCKVRMRNRKIDYYIGCSRNYGKPTLRCCFSNGDKKAENFCRGIWPNGILANIGNYWYEDEMCILDSLSS